MKIEFEYIKFRNFLSFGNNENEFHFNKGLHLIEGKNGSGKSSFSLDVLSFNLHGKPYRDIKISELINNKNGSKLWTESCFKKDNSRIKIQRGLKPDLLKIFKDDKELDLLSHKSLIQEEIDKILAINHSLFKQIVSLSILNNKPFLTLPKADKTNILESIFNIKIFGKMLKSLKKNYTELKASFDLSNKELELYKSNLQTFVDQIKDLEKAKNEFDSKKEKNVKDFETKFSDTQSKFLKVLEDIRGIDLESLKVDLEDKKKTQDEYHTLKFGLDASNKKIEKLNEELSFLENPENDNNDFEDRYEERIQPLIKEIVEKQKLIESEKMFFKLASEAETQKVISEINSKIVEFETNIKNSNKEKTFLTKDYLEKNLEEVLTLKKRLGEIKSKLDTLKEDIDKLENGEGTCDYCKQSIDKEHQEKEIKIRYDECHKLITEKEEIQTKIQDLISSHIKERNVSIDKDIENAKSEIESLKNEAKTLKDKLQSDIQSKNEELGAKNLQLDFEKSKIVLEMISSIKEGLKTLIKDEVKAKKSDEATLNNLTKKLQEIKTKEDLLQSKTSELDKLKIQKENLHDILVDLKDQLEKLKEDKFNVDIEKLKGEFEEKKIIYKEMKTKNLNLKNKIKVCEVIKDDVLDESGIKKFFFSRLIPELNKSINTYLDHFELPIKFEFDSEFDYKIVDFGDERNYFSFSAGERFRIDLSITLSFILLNKLINGCDINVLFLDELLDTAVDGEGMELILEKLKELTEKENLCTYIISHKGLENNVYIDNVIKISKTNGFSRIEV